MRLTALIYIIAASCACLFGESGTASIRFTGAPTDGGQTCVACHTPRQGPSAGSLSINVLPYQPGIPQNIRVTVQDPSAMRWGFQLTARAVSDERMEAGTFSASDTAQVRCDDGSRVGLPGPCNSMREFAEHTSAPQTAPGAGFTFNVLWTPPINEIGDVRMYAAAVAADGDGTAAGDRTYTAIQVVQATGACNATTRPTLQKVVNGASFLQPISSNAMLSVFGLGFQVPGRSRAVGLGDFVNNAFPKELACVAVEIAGQRAPIAYVQQDQINIQAPALPSSGPVPVIVILNPGRQNELRSDLGMLTSGQALAPALFIVGSSGSVAAQFSGTTTLVGNPAVISGARAAKPGDLVTLYATGLGTTNPSANPGELATGAATVTTPVSVTLGTVTLLQTDVLYAGLSPGSITGLYQINIRIPTGVPSGDVPVMIALGGFSSQPNSTLAISTP